MIREALEMQVWRCVSVALVALITLENVSTTITNKKITKILKAVKLPGGYMEVVQEDFCSDVKIIRLTCRSLRAFVFVLEAEYQRENTQNCQHRVNNTSENIKNSNNIKVQNLINVENNDNRVDSFGEGLKRSILFRDYRPIAKTMVQIQLRGNYIRDEEDEEKSPVVDLRNSFNRRCSGHHHCRFNIAEHHPASSKWHSANLHLKYACIPETAIRRYCNVEIPIDEGEAGYIKSPGYPHYYPGEHACGWTFKTIPGRRVSLVFHDLNIRSPEPNGHCLDFIRVEENNEIIFQSCGTKIGEKIVSKSNKLTLNLVTSSRLYPARGFLLKYEAIGCPEIQAPNGSFISNDSVNLRTFQCHLGRIFPDTRQQSRTLDCQGGQWNESINSLPTCITAATSVVIKTDNENTRLSSLSDENNVLGAGVLIDRLSDTKINSSGLNMTDDKGLDTTTNIIVPICIILMIFGCNAFIVYFIFRQRKRLSSQGSTSNGEVIALNKGAPSKAAADATVIAGPNSA